MRQGGHMSYQDDVQTWIETARKLLQSDKETLDNGRTPAEEAEQYLERALRYQPTHQEGLMLLVEMYIHSARGPLISKRLNRLVRDHPEEPSAYRAVLAFMRASGKLDLAVSYFQNLLEKATEKTKPVIRLCIAELYASQKDFASLQKECQTLMESPPVDPIMQGLLMLEYNDANGIFQLADKIEEEAIKHTLWGMVMEAQGDFEQAGQYFFSAGSVENPPWYALNALANMWLNAKNLEYANAYLEQVSAINPSAPEVQLTRARILQANGKYEQSREIKKKLVYSKTVFPRIKKLAGNLLH